MKAGEVRASQRERTALAILICYSLLVAVVQVSLDDLSEGTISIHSFLICYSFIQVVAVAFSLAVNQSSARCGKSFMRIESDMYADLRIENVPRASMDRNVGMNLRFESGSVRIRLGFFQGLFATGTRAEEGPR